MEYERMTFRKLTTREFRVLSCLYDGTIRRNSDMAAHYEVELIRLSYKYGYATVILHKWAITDTGKAALLAHIQKEPTATKQKITIMLDPQETTILIEENGKLQEGWITPRPPAIVAILIEEEKQTPARLYRERIVREKKQQALTDLLNALAAFEALLEEEQAQAKLDYEKAMAGDGYGSYSEGIEWGYKYGVERVAREWQECKEAIAKIGGES